MPGTEEEPPHNTKEKILRIFGVDNRPLLIGASLVCFMLFAFFYVCVFRWTAHAYYSIVKNGIKE